MKGSHGFTSCRPCCRSVRKPPPSFVILETLQPPFGKTLPPFTKAGRRLRPQSNCMRRVEWIELGRERGIASRREEETFPAHRSTCPGPASTLFSATVRRTGYRVTRSTSEGPKRCSVYNIHKYQSNISVKDIYLKHVYPHTGMQVLNI